MQSLNRLGLRVAGLTGAALLVVFGLYWGIKVTWHSMHPDVAVRPSVTPAVAAASAYDDTAARLKDLPVTDQNTVDTDHDGIPDLQEINQGTDPNVAGSAGDNVPALGKNVKDLSTYTNRYLSTLPEDTPHDQIYTKEKLTAYVDVNKGQLLPDLPANTVKTAPGVGKEAVQTYLDAISPDQNKDLQVVSNQDIEQATMQQFQGQTAGLDSIVTKLTKNVQVLQSVAAPQEALTLHTKLVQATQALLNNVKLLKNIQNDFVGTLVGSKNIEDLGPVFQDIGNQIQTFDKQYNF